VHSIDGESDFNPMVNTTDSNLRKVGKYSRYLFVQQGESVQLQHGGLLVEGLLRRSFGVGNKQSETFYDGLTFILPSLNHLEAEANSEVIIFDEPIFQVKTDDRRGTWVELDIKNLGKSTAAKSKYRENQAFGNFDERMLQSENDKKWRMAAKDGLMSDQETERALKNVLDTKLHALESVDHHDQARQLDSMMSNMQNSKMAGHAQTHIAEDRSNLNSYQELRRKHTGTAQMQRSGMYQDGHHNSTTKKSEFGDYNAPVQPVFDSHFA